MDRNFFGKILIETHIRAPMKLIVLAVVNTLQFYYIMVCRRITGGVNLQYTLGSRRIGLELKLEYC